MPRGRLSHSSLDKFILCFNVSYIYFKAYQKLLIRQYLKVSRLFYPYGYELDLSLLGSSSCNYRYTSICTKRCWCCISDRCNKLTLPGTYHLCTQMKLCQMLPELESPGRWRTASRRPGTQRTLYWTSGCHHNNWPHPKTFDRWSQMDTMLGLHV